MVLNTSCMELLMVLAVRRNGYSLDMYDCLWSYRERVCGCVWSWLGGVLECICSWTGCALNCMVLNNCVRLKLGGVQGCIWSRLVCACLILGPMCLVVCDPWLGDDAVYLFLTRICMGCLVVLTGRCMGLSMVLVWDCMLYVGCLLSWL